MQLSREIYLKYTSGEEMELDKTHSYYCQVQHEMFVCDTNFSDFIVWTPKELAVVRVLKDEKFITEYTQKCTLFRRKCILPELMLRKITDDQFVESEKVDQK